MFSKYLTLLIFAFSTLFSGLSKVEFFKAVLNGETEIVQSALKESGFYYVRLRDKSENTPLHVAASNKKGGMKGDLIALLLKYGADVNSVNKHLSTPLHIAVSTMNLEGVRLLLKDPNIHVNERNHANLTPLLFATGNHSIEIIKLLLTHPDIDPNVGTSDGVTPIHSAAMWGFKEELELLLDHPKAQIDVKQRYGSLAGATPLHYGAKEAQSEIVSFLIQKGANPNEILTMGLYEGFTPIHLAVMHHNPIKLFECLKLLVKAGASVDIKAKSGKRPIDLTSVDVIQAFLSDPNPNYKLKKRNHDS